MLMRLEVLGETQINRELLRWEAHVADFTPLFAALVEDFHEMERRQFASEGHAGGAGWAPLATSTVAGRGGSANPILDRTGISYGPAARRGGTGRESLTTSHGEHSIVRILPDELVVGTSDPVMGYHQRGHVGPTPLPQRKVVSMTEEDRRRWVKAAQAWMVGTPLTSVLSGPRGL
ncbi:MAG: phage virion morphogenesis protein [Actinomycetota bacterium]|nr:phage virion morphogenesis protein [Actinomycetota bacterium]